MAVTRTQSIRFSSLKPALRHRFSPPKETLIARGIDADLDQHKQDVNSIGSSSSSVQDFILTLFEYVESALYTRKIRKNSTVQELLISYSPTDFTLELFEDDDVVVKKIEEDIALFSSYFLNKFGFKPFLSYFIHRNNAGIYHVHIIFSLMNYTNDKPKKIRWSKWIYFDLVKYMSKHSPRITLPAQNKGIGAYPLWLVRKLEREYGEETARNIIKIAREYNYTTRDLIDYHHEIYEILLDAGREKGFSPGI